MNFDLKCDMYSNRTVHNTVYSVLDLLHMDFSPRLMRSMDSFFRCLKICSK
uniref:Uncharacterized protein n=1 Tax=Anguilla anguilla TaxID=7936 RepID=A0A0E9R3M3_ANGAN